VPTAEPVVRETVDVLVPPPRLRPHVVCAVLRRVSVADAASPLRADVHANPYACLNSISEGCVHAPGRGNLPSLFVTGPFTSPVLTEVRGPLSSVSVVMQPWVLPQVFGRDAASLVDAILQLDERKGALQELRTAAAATVMGGAGDAALWTALDGLLAPAALAQPRLAFDRLRSEGVRAAAQECGWGERQYRRVFLRHMGLRPSAWLRCIRIEAAMTGMAAPQAALSELALDAGYADQAHLSREARSLIRHTPAALMQALTTGDTAWPLRPACPISSRPAGPSFLASEDDL